MKGLVYIVTLGFLGIATCVNFPWESVQLTDEEITAFPSISFGDSSNISLSKDTPACREHPGSEGWPSDDEWTNLNTSLGGVLLKPVPPAAVCYSGPLKDMNKCMSLLFDSFDSRFYLNDPLTVLTEWPQGSTCPATFRSTGNCTQGGFPVYVVNVTTVQHVQATVNFARNKNLRVVIKNTGHDFAGRSTGYGALSIWTHYLKSFEFLPEYTQGEYKGMAARVGAGLEAWELYAYMDHYNMTLVVPGGSTVGAYGGWMAAGGHNTLSSVYGLGSDQALSLEVVTADGKLITADPTTNSDLFYALRGGGPATFGVVTSAIVKAYPPVEVTESSIDFRAGSLSQPGFGNFSMPPNGSFPFNFTIPFNATNPFNFTFPPTNSSNPFNISNPTNLTFPGNFSYNPPVTVNSSETFWRGVNTYFKFGTKLCDAGGTGYSYVSAFGNTSFSFSTTLELPGMSKQETFDFVQPLIDELNEIGIPVNNSKPVTSLSWGDTRKGEGDAPGDVRFATRLMPRANWENDTLFEETMSILREVIEAGYSFHGVQIAPTDKTAGYPGGSAVNPAFRKTLMHADIFDRTPANGLPVQSLKDAHTLFNSYMDKIRAVTPGAGSYLNEADVQEPNWQQSFFGTNYDRLLEIKKKRDPWGLFWAPTTVGSEAWEVRTADGLPTQNGPLCRSDAPA